MPFPWKQGDEADEGVTAFSPEERVMTGDAQDAEYLEPLHVALADVLGFNEHTYSGDVRIADPEALARTVINQLTERGWRFVTVKDWREMSHAWVMGALR